MVQIPTRDYDIDCSELKITCRYSNSRAPGGSCAAYDIEPSETLYLHLSIFIYSDHLYYIYLASFNSPADLSPESRYLVS